ncbi:hypothetical protein M408DRAFT_255634 [Serendipita vermifera MAFF 305830]|uniref:PWWP domain-containing protein n=1 Tax=Serendipita vermifera MAFF 305830 TaxID=933852 RepID=A0A0C3BI95_SERVB|nr:hypothetical protein M408DRAFT_255634 [Serendipita vermifera MAFF 305830]
MSKTPPAPAATAPDVKVGDVVLAKVKGFSAWPAVIVDSGNLPPSVKAEKPKGSSHHCVRFIPTGEFGWPAFKDVSLLTHEKIDAFLEKDKKKTSSLYKGYEIGKNPAKWILEKEEQLGQQIDLEAAAEVDQLEDETEKKSKSKKRKVAEPKPSKKKSKAAKEDDEDAGSKKKRTSRKRKAGEDSDDDDDKKESKNKKVKEDDDALANDPEATKIKEWRHQLQRAFLRDNVKPEASALSEYDETFQVIENYQGLTIQYLSYSKIGKVMKKISQLPEAHIPDNDGQFKFRERAAKLVGDWHQILNAKAGEGEATEAVNGTAEKAESAPAPAAVDGDVSIMTDA